MPQVIGDKVYLDGFEIATINESLPASVRDRVEKFMEFGWEAVQVCEECGAWIACEAGEL